MRLSFRTAGLLLAGTAIGIGGAWSAHRWQDPRTAEAAAAPCHLQRSTTSNTDQGVIIATRVEQCDMPGQRTRSAVHIYRTGETPTDDNLVFSFAQRVTDSPMTIVIADRRKLVLKVDQVTQVSRMRAVSASAGVEVRYDLSG
jgi:hypothetical protein